MTQLEQLIAEHNTAKQQLYAIENQIRQTSDGFKYLTQTRCWGSIRWESHNNAFAANQEVEQYNGDNGIVDLYTNNPNHDIENYSGSVILMSEEDMLKLSKEDVSMSRAMCNWIAKSY